MKLTCKQYVNAKWEDFKTKCYYKRLLEIKKTNKKMAEQLENDYTKKWENEWKNIIIEYGRSNRLENKIIYSFIKSFGYEQLLYQFRNGNGLKDWIPSKKYTKNNFS